MGIIQYLKDALDIRPKGPVYDVDDLEYSWKQYESHVKAAFDCLDREVAKFRPWEVWEHARGDGSPVVGKARARYTYLRTIRGWVEDEFIAKIRKFGGGHPVRSGFGCSRRDHAAYLYPNGDLANSENHMDAAREYAKDMMDALTFFLCDTRSTFRARESLDGGDCTLRDVSDWYLGGKGIIVTNMERIEAAAKRMSDTIKERRRA